MRITFSGISHSWGTEAMIMNISVSVQQETDTLQYPVRDVLLSGKICFKHQPHPHGIATIRRGVNRCPQCILQVIMNNNNSNNI